MKKDIKAILSISLATMEVTSFSKTVTPIDISLYLRDDSGDPDSTNLDDSIPSMDEIPSDMFSWHGDNS